MTACWSTCPGCPGANHRRVTRSRRGHVTECSLVMSTANNEPQTMTISHKALDKNTNSCLCSGGKKAQKKSSNNVLILHVHTIWYFAAIPFSGNRDLTRQLQGFLQEECPRKVSMFAAVMTCSCQRMIASWHRRKSQSPCSRTPPRGPTCPSHRCHGLLVV